MPIDPRKRVFDAMQTLSSILLRPSCQWVGVEVGRFGQSRQNRADITALRFRQPNLLGNKLRRWLSALKLCGEPISIQPGNLAVREEHHIKLKPNRTHTCERVPAATTADSTAAVLNVLNKLSSTAVDRHINLRSPGFSTGR